MIKHTNQAKDRFFERINNVGKHKLTLDLLFYYFLFFVLTVHELAHMGAGLTRGTGGGRGEGTEGPPQLLHPDKHALAPQRRSPPCSLLDPADALHLEGLGVRAPLSEMLVVARVVITLQHILKASVAGKLGANPAGKGKRQTVTLERHQRGKHTGDPGTRYRHISALLASLQCLECALLPPLLGL